MSHPLGPSPQHLCALSQRPCHEMSCHYHCAWTNYHLLPLDSQKPPEAPSSSLRSSASGGTELTTLDVDGCLLGARYSSHLTPELSFLEKPVVFSWKPLRRCLGTSPVREGPRPRVQAGSAQKPIPDEQHLADKYASSRPLGGQCRAVSHNLPVTQAAWSLGARSV